jgi:hypothetical protein
VPQCWKPRSRPPSDRIHRANANGQLALVDGFPFKTVGEMIGSDGKFFISLSTNWVHVYAVESNGAIGKPFWPQG